MSTLNIDRCVVRDTAARKGRSYAVTPGATAARHLHYGRIILDASEELSFDTGERDTGLVCLKGHARVTAGGSTYSLVPFDALYVPRDATIEIASAAAGVDFAELAAPVIVAGREQLASTGGVRHIPSDAIDGATTLDEEVVLVDIFTPIREDFPTT